MMVVGNGRRVIKHKRDVTTTHSFMDQFIPYQVENFGIHINVDGSVMYGIYVEAIMHRKDEDISLDLLSRLLVDVHQDSSEIMNDLLSKYQKSLMDMVFMGDTDHRAKFNMIIADGIEPFMVGAEYMDREDHENELKQVKKGMV